MLCKFPNCWQVPFSDKNCITGMDINIINTRFAKGITIKVKCERIKELKEEGESLNNETPYHGNHNVILIRGIIIQ